MSERKSFNTPKTRQERLAELYEQDIEDMKRDLLIGSVLVRPKNPAEEEAARDYKEDLAEDARRRKTRRDIEDYNQYEQVLK